MKLETIIPIINEMPESELFRLYDMLYPKFNKKKRVSRKQINENLSTGRTFLK